MSAKGRVSKGMEDEEGKQLTVLTLARMAPSPSPGKMYC